NCGVSVGVNVGNGVNVGTPVGATPANSNAPISHTALLSPSPSTGRGAPRWSVAGQYVVLPASIAGLLDKSAWVSVSPPLFCSAPNCGSVLTKSPVLVKPQLLPESRL